MAILDRMVRRARPVGAAIVAGLILATAAEARPAPPPPSEAGPLGCYRHARGEVPLQHGRIDITLPGDSEPYQVSAVAVKSRRHAGMFGVSQTELRVWRSDCIPVLRRTFPQASLLRFEEARLGDQPLLHVVARYPGGSGELFRHHLIVLDPLSDPQELAPRDLAHTNMGGFFVGDLGEGRGPGIAIWDAEWNEGAHYDPHPARMFIYRWSDRGFHGPERLDTAEPVAAEPDAAPLALGLRFRDSSRPEAFISEETLISAPTIP
jgi:hypothetical protein